MPGICATFREAKAYPSPGYPGRNHQSVIAEQQPSYTLGLGDKDGHSLDAEGLKLQGADTVEGHTL